MKGIVLSAAILLGPLSAGAAMADDDGCNVAMADWQPREAVQKMAEARGWTVFRIKTDDGCYEIKGRDGNGRAIEAKVNPGSLAIVDTEYEDEDESESRDAGQNAAPAGSVTPPDNGLFNKGSAPTVQVQ